MSRQADEFVIGMAAGEAGQACRRAAVRFGWKVSALRSGELSIAVPMIGSSWPSKVRVRFTELGLGQTRVALEGKIGGVGLDRDLSRVLFRLRTALERPDEPDELYDTPAPDVASQARPVDNAVVGAEMGSERETVGTASGPDRGEHFIASQESYQQPPVWLHRPTDFPQRKPLMSWTTISLLLILGVTAAVAITMLISVTSASHRLQQLQQQTQHGYSQVQQALQQPGSSAQPMTTELRPATTTTATP
jgi:hypothetical protein